MICGARSLRAEPPGTSPPRLQRLVRPARGTFCAGAGRWTGLGVSVCGSSPQTNLFGDVVDAEGEALRGDRVRRDPHAGALHEAGDVLAGQGERQGGRFAARVDDDEVAAAADVGEGPAVVDHVHRRVRAELGRARAQRDSVSPAPVSASVRRAAGPTPATGSCCARPFGTGPRALPALRASPRGSVVLPAAVRTSSPSCSGPMRSHLPTAVCPGPGTTAPKPGLSETGPPTAAAARRRMSGPRAARR